MDYFQCVSLKQTVNSDADITLRQCVSCLLRKIVTKDVLSHFNAKHSRGKRVFAETISYQLIKSNVQYHLIHTIKVYSNVYDLSAETIREFKRFKMQSDADIMQAFGKVITNSKYWKHSGNDTTTDEKLNFVECT